MNTFCTIITADYFPYAVALFKSLRKYNSEISLHILIADNKKATIESVPIPGVRLIEAQELYDYDILGELFSKYAHTQMDSFRWAAKPVLISYLLENGFGKVLYTDCDIFFFNNYEFLFKELDHASILLTPHWHNPDPAVNENSFITLFTNGIFNAGFIGASSKGLPALKWWAEACHFKMGEIKSLGIHDDQKYLDALPVLFEHTKIIRHKGCNVATWNFEECKRVSVNGTVMINGEYPVIFIHFNQVLAKEILKRHDKFLLPYPNEYQQIFEESGYLLSDYMKEIGSYITTNPLLRSKWKLKLRTRIK